MRVYDLATQNLVADKEYKQPSSVQAVAIAPNSSKFVIGGVERVMKVFTLSRGDDKAWEVKDKHKGAINCLEFGREGISLFSGSEDFTIKHWDCSSWDVSNWSVIRTLVATYPIKCLSPHENKDYLCSGGQDGTVGVWDVKVKGDLRSSALQSSMSNSSHLSSQAGVQTRAMDGHQGPITGIHFSHEGMRILSSSGDGTAQIWNLAAQGREALTLVGHKMGVEHVEVSAEVSAHR